MNESTETRSVTLGDSSWNLLDEGAKLCGGSPDEILDSVLQGFLADDGGEMIARRESLAALKRMFGKNQG